MTVIFSLKAISAAITSFWARSALLLWCLAASCLVALIALAAGSHWQVGDTPAWLAAYGTILGLAFLVLLVFAAFKTYGERAPPTLLLLPQDDQSFWTQCRHPDGKIITQLTLRFQAKNLTDGAIRLSGIKLCRPFVRRHAILTKAMRGCHPNAGLELPIDYSLELLIEPHSLTYASVTITIDHPVGSMGKTMRAVVAMQDHAGRWHKLICPHLRMIRLMGAPP
jgi:hypothetical protein